MSSTYDAPEDLQVRVLRAYTLLRLTREDWGGVLIVCCGLGPEGEAMAMAANIAGAVCLSIEDRAESLKRAGRLGCCDFLVNTLDEALRAMKNEVRKRLPVSVGLLGRPSSVVRELVERGVQPKLLMDFTSGTAADLEDAAQFREDVAQLRQQGALLLHLGHVEGGAPFEHEVDGKARLQSFVEARGWVLRVFPVLDGAALRAFDARALSVLPDEDALRRQWARSASRVVQRQRPLQRALWVTADEERVLALRATD